jgi:hypothetical protein
MSKRLLHLLILYTIVGTYGITCTNSVKHAQPLIKTGPILQYCASLLFGRRDLDLMVLACSTYPRFYPEVDRLKDYGFVDAYM